MTSPAVGSTVTGPVTVTCTYDDAYQVVVSYNAGQLADAQMSDPDGDDTGTWTATFDPSAGTRFYGNVEITVRCFATSDRYYRWGAFPHAGGWGSVV